MKMKIQKDRGVIKISHFYMAEIVRLCLYTIKNSDDQYQKNRSQRILDRVKILNSDRKNKNFEKYKDRENRDIPI